MNEHHPIVIGTAGHIDHGKTALIKALTGIDTDRLPEEKEREMTIDLGFAYLGENISIIDVPGHEKFIKNMLAGVTTIDFIILVIAADDGIMPQTREHFDILRLLNIPNGIIAVTKIDLVDGEWLQLVIDDIKAFVQGTFLDKVPIVPLSTKTGEGIEKFKDEMLALLRQVPARSDTGIFRLWIDRIFQLKGMGNIVAGSVLSGSCKVGDILELLPIRKTVRIRKIQKHHHEVSSCQFGDRAGFNIIGIDYSELKRGFAMVSPGYYQTADILNAQFFLLNTHLKPLRNYARVRFHLGTGEVMARIINLKGKEIRPGEDTIVQLRLEEQVSAGRGDRYIIRSYSPMRTIGGGGILEVSPPKVSSLTEDELKNITALQSENPAELIAHYINRYPSFMYTVKHLSSALSILPDIVKEIMHKLVDENKVLLLDTVSEAAFVHRSYYYSLKDNIAEYIKTFHKNFPYKRGIKKSELQNQVLPDDKSSFFESILKELMKDDIVKIDKEIIYLRDHEITLTDEQKNIQERIEKILLEGRFVTPDIRQLKSECGNDENEIEVILRSMVEQGIIIELREGNQSLYFHKDNMKTAQYQLIEYLKYNKEIRLSTFKDMLSSTRKYILPILNYFDNIGITERTGDVRILRNDYKEKINN